jgi:small conductance mechanosensitive channel
MDSSAFSLENLIPLVSTVLAGWGLKVLGALVVLFIGRQLAKWIRRGVRGALQRGQMDATLVPFISSLVYYLVLAFVVIAVLGMVGIQTASIIAVLGAAGLAVGLALQGTLSNFASGVMLLVFRPFKVGDYIEAAGSGGTVQAVGIFTTTLTTPDNVGVVIPNTAVWGSTIKNYAAQTTRRLDLVVRIGYSDDIGTAMDTISRVLQGDPRVLPDPAPVVAVSELGDSSVNLVVRPWCRREDFWPLRCDLTRAFKEELERAGCSIPFPQRDVHLHHVAESAA